MRGQQERTGSLFSYVSIEDRIPASPIAAAAGQKTCTASGAGRLKWRESPWDAGVNKRTALLMQRVALLR